MAEDLLDVDALLASLGDDAPSGEDLEYDPDFIGMELAIQPKEEQQVGDSVIEGEEPEYREVKTLAVGILERSHDLRAAVYLAEATLALDGFAGFANTLSYIRKALEDRWDTVFPQLDADDDNDPTMRINTISGLTGANTVMRALRRAPLSNSRGFGKATIRDLMIAEGLQTASGDFLDSASISASFQDSAAEELAEIAAAVTACRDHVKGISAAFDQALGAGYGPDLEDLDNGLAMAETALAAGTGSDAGDTAGADAGGDPGHDADGSGPAAGGGGGGGGAIRSSSDVIATIDRICEYYARSEPSSPVPILLTRARRLVSADFMTIIADMAEDSLRDVRRIGGIEAEDE